MTELELKVTELLNDTDNLMTENDEDMQDLGLKGIDAHNHFDNGVLGEPEPLPVANGD